MGYRITYGQTVSYKFFPNKNRKIYRRRIIAGIAIVTLLAGLLSYKSAWMRLLPGEERITFMALSNMVERLKNGEPMKEAVTVFCQELVSYDK